MSQGDDLDPVLMRQLKRAGLGVDARAPTQEAWAKFLRSIHEHYEHSAQDRALLNRSLELSTGEMGELKEKLESQRDQLRGLIFSIADALGWFSSVLRLEGAVSGQLGRGTLETAKRDFTDRLGSIFGDSFDSDETSQFSGIHSNMARLADELVRLLMEIADKASMKKELEVASAVQRMLVPGGELIESKHLQAVGSFHPAAECGGDWWGFRELSPQQTLLIVGDVTGHGVSSAILTGVAKAACDVACSMSGGAITCQQLLRQMNHAIYSAGRQQIMMTCTAAIIDTGTNQVSFANAGHPFPYLLRGGQIRPLVSRGQPLGAVEDGHYEATQMDVASGDIFLWFTDGIIESENETGEQFSERRLRAVFQRAAARGPIALRDAIWEALNSFRGQQPQGDDITFVISAIK